MQLEFETNDSKARSIINESCSFNLKYDTPQTNVEV